MMVFRERGHLCPLFMQAGTPTLSQNLIFQGTSRIQGALAWSYKLLFELV
jgi:hypothetical protein